MGKQHPRNGTTMTSSAQQLLVADFQVASGHQHNGQFPQP